METHLLTSCWTSLATSGFDSTAEVKSKMCFTRERNKQNSPFVCPFCIVFTLSSFIKKCSFNNSRGHFGPVSIRGYFTSWAWEMFSFFPSFPIFLSFSSRNTETRKVVVAPCLDPACGLQPPSALGRCGYWQMGRREKSQYYTSSCSNFSPLPLKWCSRRRKLEAELVMNKVNRPLDPILPAITLKPLLLLRRQEKPSVVGASLLD